VQEKSKIKPSRVNFLDSPAGLLRVCGYFMAFCCELSHAAPDLSSGSFTLAGIYLEEVFGAGLQIL
jgi:hypothetical protein